ncbi:MAG: hypothetical protein J6R80_04950, partial [Kiritimatiellae bacterium]|nr:hypothetical protein [Kiritimatiellia bacterium]
AKTDTFRDARRLTYRVRPMREGLLWFPALTFTYENDKGEKCSVLANTIPVHARAGAQVVVDGMEENAEEGVQMPKPPSFVSDIAYPRVGKAVDIPEDDELFQWRKALSNPTASEFAKFDYPAARLNEAICFVKDGNWLKAMRICRLLEWRIGQTPEIEELMVSAIALRKSNAAVELPVWRQVMRPLLRLAWMGRIAAVLGAVFTVSLVLWLLGRIVRALACVAFIFALLPLSAETIETVTTNKDGSIVHKKVIRSNNGFSSVTISSSTGGGIPSSFMGGGDPFDPFEGFDPFARRSERPAKVDVAALLKTDKPSVSVGENFNLILSVEMPKNYALADDISLSVRESANMQQIARPITLSPKRSSNPTNIVSTIVFPMRALSPMDGPLHYSVDGSYISRNRGFSLFRSSYPFSSGPKTALFSIEPLPEEGRPYDFGGVVAEALDVFEYPDMLTVGTNDVVTIVYKVRHNGFAPQVWKPRDVAFEWARASDPNAGVHEIEFRRYFVADGAEATPILSVPYWDPVAKKYKTAASGGTKLKYIQR